MAKCIICSSQSAWYRQQIGDDRMDMPQSVYFKALLNTLVTVNQNTHYCDDVYKQKHTKFSGNGV